MGSIGKQNVSYRIQEFQKRIEEIDKPRYKEKLITDMLSFQNTLNMPDYKSDTKEADLKELKRLFLRIKRGDYGSTN